MQISLSITVSIAGIRGIPPSAGPSGNLPAAATGDVRSLWIGQAEPTSITATARTNDLTGETRLVASTSETFGGQILSAPLTPDAEHYFCRGTIAGLAPGTDYHLGVAVNGTIDTMRVGRFRTPPAGAHSFTFATASCSRGSSGEGMTSASAFSNGLIFDRLRERAEAGTLDFFLHTGDLHYSDLHENDEGAFHRAYDAVFAAPRQNAAWRSMPVLYMWDDHEYGSDNSGASSLSRSASVTAFRRRVPAKPHLTGALDAVYYAFKRGRVIFALLDGRSERGSGSFISVAQEAWLVGLMQAAAPTEVMLIQVNVPWQSSVHNDTWQGAAAQRTRIAEAAAAHMPGRVAVVAGDMHALAYVSREDSATGLPVLQAGPLDQATGSKGGPYTIGPVTASTQQYGLVEVSDGGTGPVGVTFRGISVHATTGVETERFAATFDLAPPVLVAPVLASVAIAPATGQTGTTFTATPSLSQGTQPVAYAYQWRLDGTPIAGATAASYVATAPGTLTCAVTPSNAAGIGGTAIGGPADVEEAAQPVVPVISSVTLSPMSGQTGTAFTAGATLAQGTTPVTYAYEWRLGGAPIGGAVAATYQAPNPGALTCRMRATNAAGTSAWVESQVATVTAPAAAVLWNPADKAAIVNLSNGNRTATVPSQTTGWVRGTRFFAVADGPRYFEVENTSGSGSTSACMGLLTPAGSLSQSSGAHSDEAAYLTMSFQIRTTAGSVGVSSSTYSGLTAAGAVMGIAFDPAAARIWFAVNGAWTNGDPAAGSGGYAITSGRSWAPACSARASTFTIRSLPNEFSHSIPNGFAAISAGGA